MYRQPDQTPRCVVCGATDLTCVTDFDHSAEGSPVMRFTRHDAQPGFLGNFPTVEFRVDSACACLACGHIMHAGIQSGASRRAATRHRRPGGATVGGAHGSMSIPLPAFP
jgi:hypothetical protein